MAGGWKNGTPHHFLAEIVPLSPPLVPCSKTGMFAAGWIPGFYRGGGDALIYQVIAYQTLDPERVLVAEPGLPLKREVVADWQQVKSIIIAA